MNREAEYIVRGNDGGEDAFAVRYGTRNSAAIRVNNADDDAANMSMVRVLNHERPGRCSMATTADPPPDGCPAPSG